MPSPVKVFLHTVVRKVVSHRVTYHEVPYLDALVIQRDTAFLTTEPRKRTFKSSNSTSQGAHMAEKNERTPVGTVERMGGKVD